MKCYIIICSYFLQTIIFYSISLGQDSLKLADIQQFCYPFTIENEEFQGEGAAILTKAIANAHITMLGDNNRSKLESEFTSALIEVLNQNNYNNMVLETGYGSSTLLNSLAEKPDKLVTELKEMNRKYGMGDRKNPIVPFPDFKSIEAAYFFQSAAEKKWKFYSLGADGWTSYQFYLDELFNNLSTSNQAKYSELYHTSSKVLKQAYGSIQKQSNDALKSLLATLRNAASFNQFLAAMASFDINKDLVEAIQFSLDYWEMYGQRDFYTKNKRQAIVNKQQLVKQLEKNNFDFKKDKLFVKMWVSHLAKGTTVNGFYGVGNMLQELAAYHGKTSVSIAIARRFYEEDGVVKDILEGNNRYLNFKELIPLGQKDSWILVDLRKFNKAFYWQGYQMSVPMHKILARYDFLVIPQIDSKGTINY